MSQHSSIVSPVRNITSTRADAFRFEDDDNTSSLQALINILRQPQDHACPHCFGRGTYLTGSDCEHCLGSGKRPRARAY